MDLRQLEYFVRVAELGSFTRAAQQLRIAQPALSRQVRLLEVELRQNLLTRNGRGAVPTEAGKLMLEHGRGILHQVERAKEDLGRVRGGLSGRVAVGMPTSVARVLAVPLTREFRKQLPEATIAISEGLSVAMQEALINGRLDIALLYNAMPSSDVELVPLLEEALYLVKPTAVNVKAQRGVSATKKVKTEKVALEGIAALPLVIPTRPNAIRNLVETRLGDLGLRPTIALEIDGVSAILELVADGAGCAVLPQSAVMSASGGTAAMQRFEIAQIDGLLSRLSIATSAQRPSTLTQRAMLDLISSLAKPLIVTQT
ncbi:LysR substrate-binding domain-containing protein [Variovorax sp. PCZ-1]|uniref:LysR substrate-binding domain-containing protein n=1 Tax=Variovorax sp. PCZ-1 TaxID=2835533 RepID=UPI001BCAEF0D|nr:LysR substrate-binding domain-containing protein [Variovorax sp. PCZ-1]MBS7808546.1 LysR family transcriptional regulator [Variovorax sp. PCZ-1]